MQAIKQGLERAGRIEKMPEFLHRSILRLLGEATMKRVDLAKRFKAWRKREGLTQKQAAELLPVALKTYQDYEQGRRGHGVSTLMYRIIMEKTAPKKARKSPK